MAYRAKLNSLPAAAMQLLAWLTQKLREHGVAGMTLKSFHTAEGWQLRWRLYTTRAAALADDEAGRIKGETLLTAEDVTAMEELMRRLLGEHSGMFLFDPVSGEVVAYGGLRPERGKKVGSIKLVKQPWPDRTHTHLELPAPEGVRWTRAEWTEVA